LNNKCVWDCVCAVTAFAIGYKLQFKINALEINGVLVCHMVCLCELAMIGVFLSKLNCTAGFVCQFHSHLLADLLASFIDKMVRLHLLGFFIRIPKGNGAFGAKVEKQNEGYEAGASASPFVAA